MVVRTLSVGLITNVSLAMMELSVRVAWCRLMGMVVTITRSASMNYGIVSSFIIVTIFSSG